MKRIICLILMLAVVCGINTQKTAFADEDVYFIICNPTAVVNVRRSANMHTQIVGNKYFGDEVIADKSKNGFFHIRAAESATFTPRTRRIPSAYSGRCPTASAPPAT